MNNIDEIIYRHTSAASSDAATIAEQALGAHFAQNGELRQLSESLRKSLKESDSASISILEGRLRQARMLEAAGFYRALAREMKEAIELIDGEKNASFKAFLVNLYARPIEGYLHKAADSLDDADDKAFCRRWLDVIEADVASAEAAGDEYSRSQFSKIMDRHGDFTESMKEIGRRRQAQREAKDAVNVPELTPVKSRKQYRSSGGVIAAAMGVVMCALIYAANVDDGDYVSPVSKVFLLAPLALLLYMIVRYYLRGRQYDRYVEHIEGENEKLRAAYEAQLRKIDSDDDRIRREETELLRNHPYSQAKREAARTVPEWEAVVERIDRKFPRVGEDTAGSAFDPLLPEVARAVVAAGSASTAVIQRQFDISYYRAERLMDTMTELSIIDPTGKSPRRVRVDSEGLNLILRSLGC